MPCDQENFTYSVDVWLLARRWNNINDLWAITLERMKNRTDSSVEKITSTHSSLSSYLSRSAAYLSPRLYHSFSPSLSLSLTLIHSDISLFNPLFPCPSFSPSFPSVHISLSCHLLSHLWGFPWGFPPLLGIRLFKLISFSCFCPNRFFSGVLVIQICVSEQGACESPIQQKIVSLIVDEYKSACCCLQQYSLFISWAVYIAEWRLWMNFSSLSVFLSFSLSE